MVIYFNVPEARKFLETKGFVYTVRRNRRSGITMAREGSYFKFREIGKVLVVHVRTVDRLSDLYQFAGGSGFDSKDQWLSAIRKMHTTNRELYYVELLKNDEQA